MLGLMWGVFFWLLTGFCSSRKGLDVCGRFRHTVPAGLAQAQGAGSGTEPRASPQGCRAKCHLRALQISKGSPGLINWMEKNCGH